MKRYTVDDVNRLFRADVTADEINSLFRAAANGDKAAIKRIDKYCRELWRDHPDIAAEFDMPKSCAEALEQSKRLKAKITATIDDPISRIMHARVESIRQSSDPGWNAFIDIDARQYRQGVYERMGQPVALPPQNVPKLPPDKFSKRRQQVLDMTLEGTHTEKEIAQAIGNFATKNTVRNDKAWLKRKGYLDKLSQK